MENTPTRIAADILIASLGSMHLNIDVNADDLVDAFKAIHDAVHAAAAKDKNADLFYVFSK